MVILFTLIYYLISNQIFSKAYSKISIPTVFTNLSVILGIYSYGVIGVVYGPLILTIITRIFHACRDN
jgi:predicted PurR-regulated permease PerM